MAQTRPNLPRTARTMDANYSPGSPLSSGIITQTHHLPSVSTRLPADICGVLATIEML